MSYIVGAAVLIGPILVIGIYWFGLRHARKHDS
jgi:hypothetical protein